MCKGAWGRAVEALNAGIADSTPLGVEATAGAKGPETSAPLGELARCRVHDRVDERRALGGELLRFSIDDAASEAADLVSSE